jgi:hypothetical protein
MKRQLGPLITSAIGEAMAAFSSQIPLGQVPFACGVRHGDATNAEHREHRLGAAFACNDDGYAEDIIAEW